MPMRSTSSITIRIRCKCALLLAVVMMLSLASPAMASYLQEDALHLGVISVGSERVNPLEPVEREFMSLTDLLYEGLMYIDDDYKPQPALAERYQVSENGKTWYFYLREGITFHDGTPLTAHDVVATAEEILRLAEEGKGRYSTLKYFIDSIQASDNLTVVIKTVNRPAYSFLYAMNFPILKASEVQADNPVGTGAYYLDIFVPRDYMLLSAYTGWWKSQPDIRQIMVTFHSTNRELISSYEYSRVDAVLTRAITAAQYRSGVTSYNVGYRTTQLETLMMNNRSVELEDVRVRQAIRYMINMDDLVENVYYDMVTRTDTPLIPGTWTYLSGADHLQEYNKQKAIELLDASGWVDGDDEDLVREKVIDGKKRNLHLRFYVYEEQENSVRVEIADRIAERLLEVGVECNVETLTFADAKARLKAGNFDLAIAAFNMDTAPDPGFMLISGNTANYMRYNSSKMDELFKKLRKSLDFNAYSQTLQEIQQLFWEDCPFVCLYYRNGSILTRKMFTDARDVREPEVLRGIESFQR
ncbi:MAG: ABC transporter substrate-binding protein [Clostridia bacterium]|nr:ABC transporter substrate-binding protein [Clostridia bacterium]